MRIFCKYKHSFGKCSTGTVLICKLFMLVVVLSSYSKSACCADTSLSVLNLGKMYVTCELTLKENILSSVSLSVCNIIFK